MIVALNMLLQHVLTNIIKRRVLPVSPNKWGEIFFGSLKDVLCSERIVKIKFLIKEGINIFDKLQILLREIRVI